MKRIPPFRDRSALAAGIAACAALAAGCAGQPADVDGSAGMLAITVDNRLLGFDPARPGIVRTQVHMSGLGAGESLLAIDVRPADGRLYGATSTGRLVIIDPSNGAVRGTGSSQFRGLLKGREIGFDFNPVVDRIRVVDETGANLRLHPDTGGVVDADPRTAGMQPDGPLAYAPEDPNEGKPVRVTGAAYTRAAGAKWTTNYAIESAQGMLVTQGSREGDAPAKPPVTPNAGRLFTIGPLGVATGDAVGFDIAHDSMTAYASFTSRSGAVLYSVNLDTGAATRIGAIGRGEPVRGIALTR